MSKKPKTVTKEHKISSDSQDEVPTRPDNLTEDKTYRFTGNLFNLNVSHLAYLLNMMGIGITTSMFVNLPADMKSHFTYVGEDASKVSEGEG